MSVDWDKVDEAALALMHLTTSVERSGVARTWKGYDWDVLDRMFERGWISDPETKAKSVVVYEEALQKSRELFEQQFGAIDEAQGKRSRTVATPSGHGAARCECGCGTAVQGRDFVPGHDQKLRIQLEQRVGGLLALRDIVGRLEQHAKGGSTPAQLSSAVQDALGGSENAG
jgi:hypothetical protein